MPEEDVEDQECIENIVIPPQLPNILKLYTKAAMRTQPKDLLRWSYAYMKAMRDGKQPPVKDRGETEPVERAKSGLTAGFLRVMDMLLKDKSPVSAGQVIDTWEDLSFKSEDIADVLSMSGLSEGGSIEWGKVLVIFASTIPSGGDITQTMRVVCEVLTDHPDGQEPYIKFTVWYDLYAYLAEKKRVDPAVMIQVRDYLVPQIKTNGNLVGPRDFLDSSCPRLS